MKLVVCLASLFALLLTGCEAPPTASKITPSVSVVDLKFEGFRYSDRRVLLHGYLEMWGGYVLYATRDDAITKNSSMEVKVVHDLNPGFYWPDPDDCLGQYVVVQGVVSFQGKERFPMISDVEWVEIYNPEDEKDVKRCYDAERDD